MTQNINLISLTHNYSWQTFIEKAVLFLILLLLSVLEATTAINHQNFTRIMCCDKMGKHCHTSVFCFTLLRLGCNFKSNNTAAMHSLMTHTRGFLPNKTPISCTTIQSSFGTKNICLSRSLTLFLFEGWIPPAYSRISFSVIVVVVFVITFKTLSIPSNIHWKKHWKSA